LYLKVFFSWHRTTLANRLATDGPSWSSIFAEFNSGTYNNQWIIVDYNKFNAKKKEGVVWVVEQIPGLVMADDKSDFLFSNSYWPSYNVPFFPEIYNLSGYPQMKEKYGDDFSYSKCPRANIFRRNQTMVHDLTSMKNLMRYNNFEHDPLSEGTGEGAICARGDLDASPSPFGCTDSKITNIEGVKKGTVEATCSPTHDQQPPFSWNDFESWPHAGLQQTYDFDWVVFKRMPTSSK